MPTKPLKLAEIAERIHAAAAVGVVRALPHDAPALEPEAEPAMVADWKRICRMVAAKGSRATWPKR